MKNATFRGSSSRNPIAGPMQGRDALRFTQHVVDQMRDTVYWTDSTGRLIYVNEAACVALGYTRAELLSMSIMQVANGYTAEGWAARWKELKKGDNLVFEGQHRRKNGEIFPVEIRISFVEFQDQMYVCGITNDISERKKNLEQMQMQASLLEQVHNGVIAVDFNNTILYWNKWAEELYQWSSQEAVGQNITALLAPDELRGETQRIFEQLQRAGHWEGNYNVRRKDGSRLPAHITNTYLKDAAGNNIGYIGISEDISGLIKSEAALRDSEAMFNKLFHANPTAVCLTTLEDGRFLEVNDAYVKMLEWTREELTSHTSLELKIWAAPEQRQKMIQELKKHGVITNAEVDLRSKSGRSLHVNWAGGLVKIMGETRLLISIEDVTAHRQLEHAYKKESSLLRTVIDNLPDAIYIKDLQGRTTLANRADLDTIGTRNEAEVLGKTDWELLPVEVANKTSADDRQILQSGQPLINREELIVNRLGEQRWLLTTKLPYRDENGKIIGLMGIGHDITNRKQLEEGIRKERAVLRTIIDSLPDSIYMKDLEGRKTLANRADLAFTGVSSEAEVLGKSDLELYPEDVARYAIDTERAIIETGQPILNQEERLLNRQGEQRWLLTSKMPYRDENGNITGILGMGHDITNRKQMEEALRESAAKYRLLTESIQAVVWVMDAESLRFSYISPSVYNQRGYTPEEILAAPVTVNFKPGTAEIIRQAYRQRADSLLAGEITEETFFSEEIRQARKDGSSLWTEVVTKYYVNPVNGRVEVLGVTHDISHRKKMEMEIRERVKELTCLTSVARLLENESLQKDELCQGTAAALIPAMQFPELTSACIELDGARYQAGELPAERSHCLTAAVSIRGRECGQVTVYYSQPQEFILPEEQTLLDNIARMLGLWLERKQAAAQVHKLTQAVEQSPLNIFITSLDAKIVYANPAFSAVTGYSREDALGHTPNELLRSKMTGPLVDNEIQSTLLSGQTWRGEFLDHKKNGETFWEAAAISALRDENGQIVEILAIEQDISQQKADQQRIAEALELNQTVQQAAPIGIVIYKASGECIAANPAAGAIIGTSPTVLMKQNFREIKTWQANGMKQTALRTLENNEKAAVTAELVTTFGRQVRLEGSFVPFHSAGEAHLLFVFEDTSERRLAEKRIQDSQEKYRSLFDEAPIVIWEEDFSEVKQEFDRLRAGVRDWRIYFETRPDEVRRLVGLIKVIDVNEESLAFFGGQHKSDVIHGMPKFTTDESWQYFKEEFIALALGASTFECEMPTLTLREGEHKHTFLRISVASSQRESLSRVIVSIMDISARKHAEADLQAAHAELEARVQARTTELASANLALEKAARAKDEFLAAMSHELRTPLTGILGLSQALEIQLKPTLNEKQLTMLQTLQKSGQRLHELINDVLDYSRLQAGEIKLQTAAFSIEYTLQSGLQELKRQALAKEQELVMQVEPRNLTLLNDERRVKQVLTNLLNNAIKFTPRGGRIEIAARGLPDQHEVQISVRDNGKGIPPEELGRIFQPFTQLDARLAREHGGTGLGLALVKTLSELLGGRVTVESQVGAGSTFSLFLPWEQ